MKRTTLALFALLFVACSAPVGTDGSPTTGEPPAVQDAAFFSPDAPDVSTADGDTAPSPADVAPVPVDSVPTDRGSSEVDSGPSCTPRCNGRTCGPDGCGGTCGSCDAREACDLPTGACVSSAVNLVAWRGTVAPRGPRGAWDLVGDPDPMVCVTIDNLRRCSPARQDTFAPNWTEVLFGEFTATELAEKLVRGYRVELLDYDATGNDMICEGTVRSTVALTNGATFAVGCDYGSATFRLDFVR